MITNVQVQLAVAWGERQADELHAAVEGTPVALWPNPMYVAPYGLVDGVRDLDLTDRCNLERIAEVAMRERWGNHIAAAGGTHGLHAQLDAALSEGADLAAQVRALEKQRDEWKRRAAQHGCNVVEGDHECG